jgi:hypothetical protein
MQNLARTEQPFPIKVRLWLNHKVVLSYKSKWYQEKSIVASLRTCQDLVKMVRANCGGYNMNAICSMIRLNENNLYNILPAPNNPSYERQLLKLQEILTTAKSYKK